MIFIYKSFYFWVLILGSVGSYLLARNVYMKAGHLSWKERLFFITLRTVSCIIILLLLLNPVLRLDRNEIFKKKLIFLIDKSVSMGYGVDKENIYTNRLHRVRNFLDWDGIKNLKQDFDIRAFTFDKSSRRLNLFKNNAVINLKADGVSTDIGGTFSDVLSRIPTKEVAGIILFSDGQDNSGSGDNIFKELEILEKPVGIFNFRKSESTFKDVSIKVLNYENETFVDRVTKIEAGLRYSSCMDMVNVTLSDRRTVLHRESIKLKGDGFKKINLFYKPDKKGFRRLTLTVSPVRGEVTEKNNKENIFINVLKDKIKLLLIYGKPSWEFKFIKRCFQSDPNVNGKYILKLKDNVSDRLNSINMKSYNLIVIGDIKASDVGADNLRRIGNVVKNGVNLFMLGGENSFYNGGYQNSPISEIIPVDWNSSIGLYNHEHNIKITEDGFINPSLRFSDDYLINNRIWADFPPSSYANIVNAVKKGTIIDAVIAGKENYIVLARKRVGRGNVAILTSYPTWKWFFLRLGLRQENNYYSMFYRQFVRILSSQVEDRINLRTDKLIYSRGEKVNVIAALYDKNYMPLKLKKIKCIIYRNNKKINELELLEDPVVLERYEGAFSVNEFGEYSIAIRLKDGTKKMHSFIVDEPAEELKNLVVNDAFLNRIKSFSKGFYFDESDAENKFKEFEIDKDTIVVRKNFMLINSWLLLIFLILSLSSEWFFRKIKGLK